MRKKIIAGNWKMHKTPAEAVAFVKENKAAFDSSDVEVVLCVPYVSLHAVQEELKGSNIKVGAQNMHYEKQGAYTAEISAEMLSSMGVPYVIIGHSERRQYYSESDAAVGKKTKKALACELVPITCIGELLEERQQDLTFDVLRTQLTAVMDYLNEDEMANVVIAYEPVWAIGTGVTATEEQAEEACAFIRKLIRSYFNKETAEKVRILYGGSVNAKNANTLFSKENENIDGGLVGGASLETSFAQVIHHG